MKTASLFAAFLSVATLSTAWPWPESGSEFDVGRAAVGLENMLYGRQQQSSSSQQTSSAPSATGKSTSSGKNTEKSTATSGSGSSTATDSKSKADGTAGGSAAATSGSFPTSAGGNQSAATTMYDPRLPPGGVQMITPAPLSGAQYYKIGDWVTFAWNFTSLSATPTALDIIASCSAAERAYTITMNQTVTGPTGMVLWDTHQYQQTASAQLLTNEYTLIIYDAQGSISETPKAGYFAVQDTFTFGMYTGQPYTPWSSFNCPTCSGALRMSSMERQTWAFLFGMATITIASFTWFASGVFGVL